VAQSNPPIEDPVLRAIREAPPEDEQITDEERAAILEGLEALRRGEVVSDEELSQKLGL
jgi:predicted transcriptional regulator